MEVGFRGLLVAFLLFAVLGGAIAYSLWPDSDGATPASPAAPAAEEKHKSLAERLEEYQQSQDTFADAGTYAFEGHVETPDGKPVPFAEVWVIAGDGSGPLENLSCETCGQQLLDCSSPESARDVIALARAGKLTPRPLASARADAQGHFVFASVPATTLELRARAPGFSDGSTPVDVPELQSWEEPFDFSVQLRARERVRVTVLDPDEKPVRGASIAVLDRELGTVTDERSDDRGHFEVSTASDGVVWMFAEAPGFLPAVVHDFYVGGEAESETDRLVVRLERPHRLRVETRLSGQLVDAQVEVSGTDHPHAQRARGGLALFEQLPAGTVEVLASYQTFVSPKQYADLSDGETVVRVDLRPAARLSVGVLDERGEPVQDARVSIDGYGNSELQTTGDTGALVLFEHLAEGAYQVHVEAGGLRDAQRRVDLHAGDNHLEVTLQKASMLSGRVVDADGKPVPSATVELVSQIHEAAATTTSDEGEFMLQVDEPGAYRLRARETQLGLVIVQVNAPAEELVLRLEPLARIEVHVLAEKNPLKGAYVSVFGAGASVDDSGTAVTDERGIARLAGLHGGDYTINVEQSGFQRAEPRPLELAANARAEVTISLERGVEISGRVVDETGKPVANADVHTVVVEDPKVPAKADAVSETYSAFTDDSGEFAIEGLEPGHTYSLAASAEERATKAVFKVKAAASGVSLKIEPLPGVKGRVVDEAGQPIAAFRVDGKDFETTDGRFVVGREADADGKLYLNVDADGYESLSVEHEAVADLGDLRLKKAPLLRGVVVDQGGQPVSGADVTCDQCIDSTTSGGDGSFVLAVSQESPEPTVTAARLNFRGKTRLSGFQSTVVVKLEPPVRVEGIVKDPSGRAIAARITVREINGAEEERLDSGPDGKFEIDLPEGLWMFITRLSATGQTVKVVGPKVFVTLGAPPGTCAVTITVSEPVGDAWLVPGEPEHVPLESLDDDALYAGAVALDLPLPNRPTRSAGLQCGVYTLITTDSSGVRRERVDVRASEATYLLPPAPPETQTADLSTPNHPGQP